MRKQYYCIICKTKIISYSAWYYGKKHCHSCANKELYKDPKNHPSYIDGKTILNNYCTDCGIKITWNSTRCLSCANKGENNPNFINGKTNNNKCIDCEEHIEFGSKRCPSCATKGIRNGGFIDGRTTKKYYCIEKCGNEICYRNFKEGSKRCYSCENKRKHKLGIINLKGDKNSNFTGGKESRRRYCIDCNKLLNEGAYYRKAKRCKSCSMKKDLNHQWVNGSSYEPYSLEWNEGLKKFIRKRDDYICQNCFITEEEHLSIVKTKLSVHHIDYNKKNCHENNLITLCQQCNLRANYNRDKWQTFYSEKIQVLSSKNKG